MANIYYNVPLLRQEQNPICWVACVAMIRSYYGGQSVGIERFSGGFSPYNSSISNPATSGGWPEFYRILARNGFATENPQMSPNPAYVEEILKSHGPFMLTHDCQSFPYGSQWGTPTFTPNATHAVVITGVDTDNGTACMNNPWGDKDQALPLNSILTSIQQIVAKGQDSVSYMK